MQLDSSNEAEFIESFYTSPVVNLNCAPPSIRRVLEEFEQLEQLEEHTQLKIGLSDGLSAKKQQASIDSSSGSESNRLSSFH